MKETKNYPNQIAIGEKVDLIKAPILPVTTNSDSKDPYNHEEFLIKEDFEKIGEQITDEELEKINGHLTGQKNDFIDGESGKINSLALDEQRRKEIMSDPDFLSFNKDGNARYRNTDAKDLHRTFDIKERSIVNKDKINKKYSAYVDRDILDLIKKRLNIGQYDKDLSNNLVAFKRDTNIFVDDGPNSVILNGDILAYPARVIDNSENPAETEAFVYIANLSKNKRALKNRTTYRLSNKIYRNLGVGSVIFADQGEAIEVFTSRFDKSEIRLKS